MNANSRAGAIRHAEQVLAELVRRDDASQSDIADGYYRRDVAQVSVEKYRRLCADHGIELTISKQAAESIDEHGRDQTPDMDRLNEDV